MTVVPSGCTSRLQPLDVAVNKSFKAHLRSLWMQWMNTDADKNLTKSGCLKKPFYVDPDLVRRSFKVMGISVRNDGSEDDQFFEFFDYASLQQPRVQRQEGGGPSGENEDSDDET